MKLYRTELDKGLSKKLFDIDTNRFLSDDLKFFEDSIKGELSVEHSSNGYYIRGTLKIPLLHTCDRCLTKYKELKNSEFNIWLTDKDELLHDESDDVMYFSAESDVIDLSPSIRDFILLEEHIKHICKEDCKGLCPSCGTNLNEVKCGCSDTNKDSPWDILKNIKDN